MSNQSLQQYKSLYLQTARDYLNRLQKNINILMRKPTDLEIIKQARINSHSLKSQSFMMEYKNIASFSEAIEKKLTETIEKKLTLSYEMLDLMRQGIEKMIQSLKEIDQHDKDLDLTKQTKILNNI